MDIRVDADHLVKAEPSFEPGQETGAASDRAAPARRSLEEMRRALSQLVDLPLDLTLRVLRLRTIRAQTAGEPLCPCPGRSKAMTR